jgi:hypothetical protein
MVRRGVRVYSYEQGDLNEGGGFSLINIFVLLIDDHSPPFRESGDEST